MKAKEFIPPSKPRNFVAKNQKTAGAGAHKDKKRSEKQGDVKHKKDRIPMEGMTSKGIPKEKEDKFHSELDKLVHKTFGYSPDEKKEKKKGVAEVSRDTLDRYVSKASDSHGHANFAARMSKDDPTLRSYHKDQKRTAEKRRQGISRALDRMSKNQND
jgi:hypothetical protein